MLTRIVFICQCGSMTLDDKSENTICPICKTPVTWPMIECTREDSDKDSPLFKISKSEPLITARNRNICEDTMEKLGFTGINLGKHLR